MRHDAGSLKLAHQPAALPAPAPEDEHLLQQRRAALHSGQFGDSFNAANAVFEAVVKSVSRVPATMTRSASLAKRFAADVPVTPTAPRACG